MAKENNYLQVEFGTGNMFSYSKDPKDGYEEFKSSKGKISFRKYFREGVYGIYRGTSIRDTNFGKEVSVHMVDSEGTNNYISFPLFDQNKNISVYAEALITLLPALQMNFVYRIFPYAMERKGTDYKNYGVSIKHADMVNKTVREDYPLDRLTYTYEKDGELFEGAIPKVNWVKTFDGTMKKDQDAKNEFLYNVLQENATGSQKMSNKVTGGEAPKAFDGELEVKKEESAPEKVKAYSQGEDIPQKPAPMKTSAPKPAPAPAADNSDEAQNGGKKVELPF